MSAPTGQTAPTTAARTEARLGRLSLVAGAVLVGLVVVVALLSLVWTPYDPTRVDPTDTLAGPSLLHPFGTDNFGIDIASRLMIGARSCLLVGVVAVGIAALVGVPLGVAAGVLGRWPAEILMRAADIVYAFPALLLAILFAAALGASTVTAMTAIGIASIPAFARVARAGTLTVLAADYVLAARASGTSRPAIAVRHILPNIAAVLGVQASVAFGIAILAEAALSYLGLSTPPPTPTWGRMLRDAQVYLFDHPLLAVWPGLAIAGAVLGFNLLGDGLRDLLDPRLRQRTR